MTKTDIREGNKTVYVLLEVHRVRRTDIDV